MEQTLLLNATYEPLKIVDWQKAITLMCQGKVEVVAEYDREIRSVSISFKLPSVIRLLRFIRIKRKFDYVPFSRANIYARDNHECQYCGDEFPTSDLTFDHVLPVAQGGRKDWENIVTCRSRDAPQACPEAARVGSGDPDYGGIASCARKLARLPLLERGTRRHLKEARR
jgi:5-methylcytosine-specific restriction endonuclease McrA